MGKFMDKLINGDPNKPDLTAVPETRPQLFWLSLKTNIWKMVGLNGLYSVFLIPLLLFSLYYFMFLMAAGGMGDGLVFADPFTNSLLKNNMQAYTMMDLLPTYFLIATVLLVISGPARAGMYYVVRNWSWGEHSFFTSDFKDAMKKNWKQGVFFEFLTGFVLLCLSTSYIYYTRLSSVQPAWQLAKYFVLAIAVIYFLMTMYMYPLLVTYKLKIWQILKNAFLMAILNLPMTILFSLIPVAVVAISFLLGNPMYGLAVMVIIGFSFTALAQFSYCNKVFDKYLNPQIEGAQVRRGLKPLKNTKKAGA